MPFKVVVVGGGVSGLMAARQLSYFGLDITVIEARVCQLATASMGLKEEQNTVCRKFGCMFCALPVKVLSVWNSYDSNTILLLQSRKVFSLKLLFDFL